MQQLICPKCQGAMRQYERNGVHVDQCAECRGIFLDRGELERLVDAETSFHTSSAPRPAPAPSGRPAPAYGYPEDRSRYDDDDRRRYDDDDRRYHGDSHHYKKKHKRRSFMEELFD